MFSKLPLLPVLCSVWAGWFFVSHFSLAVWFSLHTTSFVLACFLVFPWAIVVEKTERAHWWHTVAQLCAVFLCFFGYYVIYSNKDMAGKPHLTTWHAYMGFAFLSLLTVQSLIGVYRMWPGTSSPKDRKEHRSGHADVGHVLLALGFSTTLVGLYKISPPLAAQTSFISSLHWLIGALVAITTTVGLAHKASWRSWGSFKFAPQ